MSDEPTQLATQEERKALVRQQLANAQIVLAPVERPVDIARAKKVPLGQIASMGTAFASMPEAFRTVTQTVTASGGGTLLQAFDGAGNALDISQLQKFNDGFGSLGSMRVGDTFQQAHFVEAGAQNITVTTAVPFDPATLAIAIALQQINQKLDSLQKTVDDMFDYMRQRDKSELRGNLQTLVDVFNGYPLNWDNERYMDNAHMKVLDIKQSATQNMDFFDAQVSKKLGSKKIVEIRGMVESRLDKVLDILKDYQLATYIYAFASFLDPMLSENYKVERLQDVARRIEEASIRYREAYSRVYDVLEAADKDTLDAAMFGGLAAAGKFLGKAVAKTPVAERMHIDKALECCGEALGDFNSDKHKRLLEKLHAAKSPDLLLFQENVKAMSALYNEPSRLLTDGENLYILPCAAEEEVA